MSVQKNIYVKQTIGWAGDFYTNFPEGVMTYSVQPNGAAMPIIGNAFTIAATNDSIATVGGTGVFAGIAVNRQDDTSFTALDSSLVIPVASKDGTSFYGKAALCKMGVFTVVLTGATASTYGLPVYFVPATGAITAVATGNTAIPNAIFITNGNEGETVQIQIGGATV